MLRKYLTKMLDHTKAEMQTDGHGEITATLQQHTA